MDFTRTQARAHIMIGWWCGRPRVLRRAARIPPAIRQSDTPSAASGAHLCRALTPSYAVTTMPLGMRDVCIRHDLHRRSCSKTVGTSNPPGGPSLLCSQARRTSERAPPAGFEISTASQQAPPTFFLPGPRNKSHPGATPSGTRARLLPLPRRRQPASDPESATS